MKMSNTKDYTNTEIIDDLTNNLENQVKISDQDDTEKSLEKPDSKKAAIKEDIPEDFEDSDTENENKDLEDDYVDEQFLQDQEKLLNEEEILRRNEEALDYKSQGNNEFKNGNYLKAIEWYTKGLKICPLKFNEHRSILYANRAASKAKIDKKKVAIQDCTKSIELNDKYVKAYLRRANLYEETDDLDKSLEDYKRILEFDPDNKEALVAQVRLPPLINERNEKLKEEMIGKLKDLGNVLLRPFGLSTSNFQLTQDPNTGGYSVNFQQNS